MDNQVEVMDVVTIEHLHEIVGGESSESLDFVIQNNIALDSSFNHRPFKADASAIILCTAGHMKLNVSMQEYYLQSNSVMMYGNNNILEILEVSEDCRLNLVIFTHDFAKETMLDIKSVIPIFHYVKENGTGMLSLDESEAELLKDFFELTHKVLKFNRPAIVHDILTAFIRALAAMYSQRVTDEQIFRTRHEEYLERFMNALQHHHKRHRSVKFYADQLHITPKYLSSVIKDVSGRSATDWIDEFVVREAKTLLKFSPKSIQEITYLLNFSTQSFFGKYFKRHTGLSPSEYRASN